MDSVGHYVWEAIKFAAICAAVFLVIGVVVPKIVTLHPGVILIIGVISGVILGDFLAKNNRGRV